MEDLDIHILKAAGTRLQQGVPLTYSSTSPVFALARARYSTYSIVVASFSGTLTSLLLRLAPGAAVALWGPTQQIEARATRYIHT